jgi:hypothetical protein
MLLIEQMKVIGIIFLLIGVTLLFRPVIEFYIRFNNTVRGVQTKITKGTLLAYRALGVFWIIFSLLLLLLWSV